MVVPPGGALRYIVTGIHTTKEGPPSRAASRGVQARSYSPGPPRPNCGLAVVDEAFRFAAKSMRTPASRYTTRMLTSLRTLPNASRHLLRCIGRTDMASSSKVAKA